MNGLDLNICIPSNKNLLESRESISSAIGFSEATNSNLIISDNSNDINKAKLWENLKLPFLNYIKSEDTKNWADNWLNAINASNSIFTSIVSDDDLIINLGESKYSYSEISGDVIAIKPIISLWNHQPGIYKLNNYNLDADTSIDRVLQYFKLSAGNNTTYYSFFRTKILSDIYNIVKYHPTKGGYLDWAITITLIASGKVILDNSKLLIYKNSNWYGDEKYIQNQVKNLFLNCGLLADSYKYERIFRALDCFILLMRKNSNLTDKDKFDTAVFLLELNIKLFKDYYIQNKNKFSEKEEKNIKKLDKYIKVQDKLDLILKIISNHIPKLEEKYKNFYYKSLDKSWNNI